MSHSRRGQFWMCRTVHHCLYTSRQRRSGFLKQHPALSSTREEPNSCNSWHPSYFHSWIQNLTLDFSIVFLPYCKRGPGKCYKTKKYWKNSVIDKISNLICSIYVHESQNERRHEVGGLEEELKTCFQRRLNGHWQYYHFFMISE